MKKTFLLSAFLLFSLASAFAREMIRSGEQSGIPDSADTRKKSDAVKKRPVKENKEEVRQNQETTDPVFYDSTTSPKEMEQEDKSP